MVQQVSPGQVTPLLRRFRDLPLDHIPDSRSARGWHRVRFKALISALSLGILTARRSLPQLETLTAFLHPDVRRLSAISGRISDTKLRDFQASLGAEDLRPWIHQQIKTEHRRSCWRISGDARAECDRAAARDEPSTRTAREAITVASGAGPGVGVGDRGIRVPDGGCAA